MPFTYKITVTLPDGKSEEWRFYHFDGVLKPPRGSGISFQRFDNLSEALQFVWTTRFPGEKMGAIADHVILKPEVDIRRG